jgi:uncharacterized membrane protein YebE (DUF533 family)
MAINTDKESSNKALATEATSSGFEDLEPPARESVAIELEQAKQFAKTLNIEEVRRGDWFVLLLQKVIQTYDRNARAAYFRQKYPGLPADDIADTLISVATRYAGIVGLVGGAAATGSTAAVLSSAGLSTPLLIGSIGAEMLCLARLQMRLVLDLSVAYDLQLNEDDPEDILMVFGYALGIAPTEVIGKGMKHIAGSGAQTAARHIVSRGRLEAVQNLGRQLGLKILQKTVVKYAAIVAATAMASGYNYLSTKSVGSIAKSHFKNRGRVTEELRLLVTRQKTYDLAFPAAVLFMAQSDGEVSPKEKEMYRALLSRMSFEQHEQASFQKLLQSEHDVLEALAEIQDTEVQQRLIDVLALMAAYDGKLTNEEITFLSKVADRLHVPFDQAEVERSANEFQAQIQPTLKEKTKGGFKTSSWFDLRLCDRLNRC